jgi:AraC-like DNA-binding protein
MFEHITLDIILLLMLYAVGATVSAMACVYLLLRRCNAFTRRISTPKRLRRWTAAFFGIVALGHLWYLPGVMMADGDAATLWMLIGALLDCLLTMPLAIVVLLCMLQDRKRPLWIAWLITAPLIILSAVSVGMRSYALVQWMQGYFLLMTVGFTAYMVRAVRQYGRWLRDNYADLEHKEVWQSLLVLAVIILLFCYYVVGYGSITYEFIIQLCGIALVAYLLWRVETLQDLSFQPMADGDIALAEAQRAAAEAAEAAAEADDDTLDSDGDALEGDGGRPQPAEGLSEAVIQEIGQLLHDRCEGNKLYLQTDLTSVQLAQALGTNRTYLGMYFSSQGTTYNAYINTLRINYFIELCRQASAAAEGQYIQAKQLANRSGYRSYRTFSVAFKQRTGQSVKDWIAEQESALQSNKQ